MRYLNTVFSIIVLLAIITFCVNNIQEFTLTFLGYRLVVPLQLWVLMVAFFVAGTVPILVVEIPARAGRYLRRRALRAKVRGLEDALSRVLPPAGAPGKEISEKSQ